MANKHSKLTAERVREFLSYDPETGVFRWKIRPGGRVVAGEIAGSNVGDGYLRIKIDKEKHRNHRLAWFYVHCVWPAQQIDHINGDRSDNRIANLREATHAENQQNRTKRTNNSSGFLGVYQEKGEKRWRAEISALGKRIRLGRYNSPEEAHAAYLRAKARLHEFQPVLRDDLPVGIDPAA